ncbi:MAG: DUF523 domain-containing protein [Clostridia bacterium]|nr:DUF523 domain-containing protein [Clostridia bacterium]
MIILVSACLIGRNCKYDGGNNRNEWVEELGKRHTLIPVCPEVLGGLPVPRIPCEIVGGTVMNRDGLNVDGAFRTGAEAALKIAEESGTELAILQSRSPSCGVREIYDGTFSGKKIPGSGVFASLLKENGFRVFDVSDAPDELTDLTS